MHIFGFDVLSIVLQTAIQQQLKWMKTNHNRCANFIYRFHLNGFGYKTIWNTIAAVICEGGIIAEEIQLAKLDEMIESGTSDKFVAAKEWIETGTVLNFNDNNSNDNSNDNSNNNNEIDSDIVKLFLPTAIFSIHWVYYKNIRKVLYFMWKTRFTKPSDGSTPPQIVEMIESANKAGWIGLNGDDTLVCLKNILAQYQLFYGTR